MTAKQFKVKSKTELEFIQAPDEWPNWPVLPVVHRGPAYEEDHVGLVWADKKPTVIVNANMFALNEIPGDTWKEKLQGFKRKEYESFEALLKEWRID